MKKSIKPKTNKGITLIRKSNDLIEARYKFDVWETRFFLSVLAQIRKEDNDFSVYRIWYKDIVKMFDLKTHQSYDLLREGAKKLMNKSFYVQYEDNGKPREVQYHILRELDYSTQGKDGRDESQEYIDLTIEQKMKPLLLQLQKSFTTYDLRNVTKLGMYAIRIYELLKQYEVIGNRTFEIEEMKRMFELEKEYPRFPNFFQKVIQPAVKEINKNTDINIREVEKLKEGRRVVGLYFHFHKKGEEEINKLRNDKPKPKQTTLFNNTPQYEQVKNDESQKMTVIEFPQTEPDRLFELFYARVVENLGVTPMVFVDLIKQYKEEQINQAIRVTQRAKLGGTIKTNVSGYFVHALKNGYTDQKEEQDKKKAKDDQLKQAQEKLTADLHALEIEKAIQIRERIKTLTVSNPEVTLQAIQSLQSNERSKKWIEKTELQLQRPLTVEDYRQDEYLREFVMQAIVEQNKVVFANIFAAFAIEMKELKDVFKTI
jgi:plasmid replication initiation protein